MQMKHYSKPILTKHAQLKSITFSRDRDTWNHNTSITLGHVTDVGTGEKTPISKKP